MPLFANMLSSPLVLVSVIFQVWMLVDAIRRKEWGWAVIILLFSAIGSCFYFFQVYRHGSAGAGGFVLPGTHRRSRVKELQRLIHDLDHAAHYAELGSIYLQQGKYVEAEKAYAEAYKRDSEDVDILARYGQTLLRLGRAKEGMPFLQKALNKDLKHDYGYTLMAYAEAFEALGEDDNAIQIWQEVLRNYSYARARFQLAHLLQKRGDKEEASRLVNELISDHEHSPGFQKARERVWYKEARKLQAKLRG